MCARKTKGKKKSGVVFPPLAPFVRLLGGPGRGVVLVLLALAGFSWLWYAAWKEVGEDLLLSEEYWVTGEDVVVTPVAKWIHDDVRSEVLCDASLDGPLSLMDPNLVPRIADAFSMHPWVARVRWVSKQYPGKVKVELDYRRPVLMVQVPEGLYPVDVEGVLLPTGDNFSPLEARSYARLVGIDTMPMAPVGMQWGDARVLESAEIAATFGPSWQELKLDRIIPSTMVEVGAGGDYTYEIVTKGGTRIRWGRAPSAELAPGGELPAAEKVAWLVEYQRQNSTLDGGDLDLRRVRTPQSVSRADPQPGEELR